MATMVTPSSLLAREAGEDVFKFFRYKPTLVGASIFIVLFAISTAVHIHQVWRRRTWYFLPLIFGGLMEVGGYGARAKNHFAPERPLARTPYIVQTLLLLIAPVLFAGSIYMILSRLIRSVPRGEDISPMRVEWVTRLFVSGDLLSLVVQGAGGGVMTGGTLESLEKGEYIVIAGLFIQIVFFTTFVAMIIIFDRRGGGRTATARKMLVALYLGSALILVRNIFRVIEYIQGNAGYLMSHEVFMYVFDAVLMFAVMVLYNIVHPGDLIPANVKERSIEGTIELDSRSSDAVNGETV